MTDFNDLKYLYQHVEDQALTDGEFHQIKRLFVKFRDKQRQESNLGEAEKARWEIHFLSFVLKKGEIRHEWAQTDKNGQVFVYPHLDLFDETTYEYLITRLDATNQPKLKARYAHILWCSPQKHKKFAKIAIDSYLKLISIYEQGYDNEERFLDQEISEAIINAYSIARQINDDLEGVKSELRRLVKKFSFSAVFSTRNLIQFMLEPKKGFTKGDFDGLDSVCRQIAERFTDDGQTAIEFLELGEAVDRKFNKQSYPWTRRIAQHYEALMKLFENGPNVAFCVNAIESYKKIHDEQKVQELEQRYSELKDSMVFGTFEKEIDLTEHLQECAEAAKKFVKTESSEEIIQYLISGKDLLPTYNEVEKSMQEQIEESPLPHMLSKVQHDQNANPVQYFDSEEEKKYFGILSGYKLQLELANIHLIWVVFREAILENKLTFDLLINFIEKHCWYGKNLSKRLTNDQIVTYNWLNLIAPALYEYFRQMDFFFTDPTINSPNFVLSIDSLTVKIEGLFRDLCQRSDITVSHQTKDNSGRNIVHERDINALLYEDAIKKLFDEDDLLFFKFLLIEKSGYNLRNRIAHSLMSFREYDCDYMHLVILALLRLGKYDFTRNNDELSDE